jgi:xylulose-5-phosphate/fructose-6-phosphate phosphoketolase
MCRATRPGMRGCSGSSPSPAAFPATSPRRRPGSIHEGGELGYALVHAFGAVFDNPELIACCVVGDGEAETGPLAAAWHSNKFLNPVTDGAVLPILHLNGYKIANPTVLARISHEELEQLFRGYGYTPYFVAGDDPAQMHQDMAAAVDAVVAEIRTIQRTARAGGSDPLRPRWPMIVLRSPKGWTGPKFGGRQADRRLVALAPGAAVGHGQQARACALAGGLDESYRPEELFDAAGAPVAEIAALAPVGERRMGANPHANGGLRLRELRLPDLPRLCGGGGAPGQDDGEATRVLGSFLRDVIVHNPDNFRVFGPDETASNRLGALFEVTDRAWMAERSRSTTISPPTGG